MNEPLDHVVVSPASIEDRDQLVKYFQRLGRDTLYAICEYLHLVPPKGSQDDTETEYNQVVYVEICKVIFFKLKT